MPIDCPRCSRVLEFSGEPPSFCSYCGVSLSEARSGAMTAAVPRLVEETVAFVPGDNPATTASEPDRVAGYRLARALGRGGMGTVYEAEEMDTGRRVALKLISSEFATTHEAVERFRQEGRLAGAIAHPRCVFVLAADEEAGRPYIVMELMPGSNLQELVDRDGPLSPEDAVSKVLDVIEGLTEAHRLGVVHRDVKPSNCFLEEDGRVKVGDFGLSKSLVGDSNLTRTGAFLGTPLYSSPEQIRSQAIDARTDVYSVSATLYFLLTGKAPFHGTDAASTLARIVSEPVPPMRSLRSDLAGELDRAVLKGLERDRDDRWQSMEDLRQALLPFAPGQTNPAGLGLRMGAFILDFFLLKFFVESLLKAPWITPRWTGPDRSIDAAMYIIANLLYWFLMFVVLERFWGKTPGKWLLGLRLRTASGNDRPALPTLIGRTSLYYALTSLIPDMLTVQMMLNLSQHYTFSLPLRLLGSGLAAVTMRARDGYRGVHDLASGTRVVRVPNSNRRRTPTSRRPMGKARGMVSRPVGVLESVGPYRVRGAVRWEAGRKVLSAEDSTLGREVWIVMKPKTTAWASSSRRDLRRPTRPRWLSGGEQTEGRWDAYVAPGGCPLADMTGQLGLSWHDARPILLDLANELSAAQSDGTLPAGLTVDQIWVEPDGRALLVDPLEAAPVGSPEGDERSRALSLLRRAAVLALEGHPLPASAPARSIRAALPRHASAILDRLTGVGDPYTDVDEFRADMASQRDRPTEVGLGQRAYHLGLVAMLLSAGLSFMFYFSWNMDFLRETIAASAKSEIAPDDLNDSLMVTVFAMIAVWPLAWFLWAFATRGGVTLRLLGMDLVRFDGRPASRVRCAWRSLIVWVPPVALLMISAWIQIYHPRWVWLSWTCRWLALVVLAAYVPLALLKPARAPHDRLSGACVVPK